MKPDLHKNVNGKKFAGRERIRWKSSNIVIGTVLVKPKIWHSKFKEVEKTRSNKFVKISIPMELPKKLVTVPLKILG